MAREQGMTHHHQRGNPVEMTCCLLRSVQTFHLQSRKRDCIQQMLNMNKAKKNSRVSFKTNDKSGNKLSFFFFLFSCSFCNPFQSGWVRFMAAITPGLGEFS